MGIMRNTGVAATVVVTILSGPMTAQAQQRVGNSDTAQVTECDRLAGLKSDPDSIVEGVTPQELAANANMAALACAEAVKAAKGTRRYMTNLGLAYFYLDRPGEAMDWFRQAADLGSATAMNAIGVLYTHGKGVPASNQEALGWFRKSADRGNARAMVNLGAIYSSRGPDKDMEQAMSWFRKAADKGDRDGVLNVGMIYYGVGNSGEDDDWQKVNDKEALKWLSAAAGMGSPDAMFYLGQMHIYGHGVKKNNYEAVRWFGMALDAGNDRAKAWLETVCGWEKGLSRCEDG